MGRAISLMQTDNNTTRRKGERVREGRTEISLRKKKRKNKIFEFQVQDVIQGVQDTSESVVKLI